MVGLKTFKQYIQEEIEEIEPFFPKSPLGFAYNVPEKIPDPRDPTGLILPKIPNPKYDKELAAADKEDRESFVLNPDVKVPIATSKVETQKFNPDLISDVVKSGGTAKERAERDRQTKRGNEYFQAFRVAMAPIQWQRDWLQKQ